MDKLHKTSKLVHCSFLALKIKQGCVYGLVSQAFDSQRMILAFQHPSPMTTSLPSSPLLSPPIFGSTVSNYQVFYPSAWGTTTVMDCLFTHCHLEGWEVWSHPWLGGLAAMGGAGYRLVFIIITSFQPSWTPSRKLAFIAWTILCKISLLQTYPQLDFGGLGWVFW